MKRLAIFILGIVFVSFAPNAWAQRGSVSEYKVRAQADGRGLEVVSSIVFKQPKAKGFLVDIPIKFGESAARFSVEKVLVGGKPVSFDEDGKERGSIKIQSLVDRGEVVEIYYSLSRVLVERGGGVFLEWDFLGDWWEEDFDNVEVEVLLEEGEVNNINCYSQSGERVSRKCFSEFEPQSARFWSKSPVGERENFVVVVEMAGVEPKGVLDLKIENLSVYMSLVIMVFGIFIMYFINKGIIRESENGGKMKKRERVGFKIKWRKKIKR